MSLHLYNSLTRRVEAFEPLDPAAGPSLYLCGPTVYNYVHIGNARGPVVFGVLAALLRRRYGKLRFARNITDVDDKINAAAKELGAPISTITDRYAAAYREDMAALGVTGAFAPNLEPAATAHIPHMIAMIQRLIDQGHAYAAEGHVLFAVDTFAEYGKLSRRDPDEMLAGARVEVAPYKRSPGDFVLWKPSSDDLPGWDSPWGRGRPGWHIECSAMAEAHLGETIDIHAGGNDLMFPHHENEVAQSECAHKHADGSHRTFSRWWVHNGMLTIARPATDDEAEPKRAEKMSKSVGNVLRVHELVRKHQPEALRYALLSAHYRQPLEWSDALTEQSVKTLDRLYGTLRDLADVDAAAIIPDSIEAALADDLNTPQALAEIARIAGEARKASDAGERMRLKSELLGAGLALGLLQQSPEAWFARGASGDDDARIQALVDERNAAKQARDFARADAIRKQLADEGILLEDTPQGVRWKRA
ncbi:MAG: cysteine--tRNA ligase [Pseudomonadota bacterium]